MSKELFIECFSKFIRNKGPFNSGLKLCFVKDTELGELRVYDIVGLEGQKSACELLRGSLTNTNMWRIARDKFKFFDCSLLGTPISTSKEDWEEYSRYGYKIALLNNRVCGVWCGENGDGVWKSIDDYEWKNVPLWTLSQKYDDDFTGVKLDIFIDCLPIPIVNDPFGIIDNFKRSAICIRGEVTGNPTYDIKRDEIIFEDFDITRTAMFECNYKGCLLKLFLNCAKDENGAKAYLSHFDVITTSGCTKRVILRLNGEVEDISFLCKESDGYLHEKERLSFIRKDYLSLYKNHHKDHIDISYAKSPIVEMSMASNSRRAVRYVFDIYNQTTEIKGKEFVDDISEKNKMIIKWGYEMLNNEMTLDWIINLETLSPPKMKPGRPRKKQAKE